MGKGETAAKSGIKKTCQHFTTWQSHKQIKERWARQESQKAHNYLKNRLQPRSQGDGLF